MNDTHSFLSFSLAKEFFAIPLLQVKEVIGLSVITPIPNTPPHFKGIINLRGQVISIIDLRAKLKITNVENGPETSIIILDLENSHLGVIVDSIESVLTLNPSDISESPEIVSSAPSQFFSGVAKIEDRLILLLDIHLTLNTEDLKTLKSHNQNAA
jgi:purine-binding chemotaxis protein CheW